MEIVEAQKEARSVFLGGSVGQAVSGIIWLVSAALGTFVSTRYGVIALALGGVFIFPLTQLTLKLLGRLLCAKRTRSIRSPCKLPSSFRSACRSSPVRLSMTSIGSTRLL
jgi:hypothetical protein